MAYEDIINTVGIINAGSFHVAGAMRKNVNSFLAAVQIRSLVFG